MKKFEYCIVDMHRIGNAEDHFDVLGSDGWELVSIEKDTAYFKREQKNLLNKLQDGIN